MSKLLSVTISIAVLFSIAVSGYCDTPKRIFIVNSYHQEYFWSSSQQQGIRDAMDGLDIEVREFFMDTKRKTSPEWLDAVVKEVLQEIENFNPDIIFTGDDNATRTIAKHFLGSEVPVVFYGVNAEPEDYGLVLSGDRLHPGSNVTGVLERHYYAESLELLSALCLDNNVQVDRVYAVTNNSYTSKVLIDFLKKIDWKTSKELIFLPFLSTFEEYREAVTSINKSGNALIIYNIHMLEDREGVSLTYEPVIKWTKEMINIPTIAFHEKYIEDGMLLGVLVSGYSQAYDAGLKGKAIFTGTPVSDIPIDSPNKGKVVINASMLKKMGMKIPFRILIGATLYGNSEEPIQSSPDTK